MSKKPYILHVCGRLETGGIRTFVKSLIDLNNNSDTVHDLLILNDLSKEFSQFPCKVYCLSYKKNNFLLSLKRIVKIIIPYQSIFIHSAHPLVVLPLIFSRKKIFLFQHGMAVSHGPLMKRNLKKIWFSIVPFVLNAKVICSNKFAFEKIKKLGIILPGRKIITIPFGTKIEINQNRIRDISEKDSITIGMASVLVPDKRNDLVIKSLASYKGKLNIDLRIAGDGPDLTFLKRLAKTIMNDTVNIDFLGKVDDMDGFYQQLDLFVHSSKNESFGLVVLEALTRFIPVAVFPDVGGCRSLIKEGKNGTVIMNGLDGLKHFWNYINDNPEIIDFQSKYISKMNMRRYDISNTRIKLDNLVMN